MFVAKNRNGPDGLVFPICMDTSNVHIDVLRQVQEDASRTIAKTAKEQKDVLREKYKRYMKGGN